MCYWSSAVCSSDLPLLRRQHSARRKALVAASITPERDDRIMVAHRGNDPLELLLSVAMAMREFREIAMGEGGLMPGQRGQPDKIGRASCRERGCQYV